MISSNLCHHRTRVVQVRILNHIPQVYHLLKNVKNVKGNKWRSYCIPWIWSVDSAKSTEIRVLLAHNEQGSNNIGAKMQNLLGGLVKDQMSAHAINSNGKCVALRPLGYWLTRTFSPQYEANNHHHSVNGLHFQMDWGLNSRIYHWILGHQCFKDNHIYQIWPPKDPHKIHLSPDPHKKDKVAKHIDHRFVLGHYPQKNNQFEAGDKTMLSWLK